MSHNTNVKWKKRKIWKFHMNDDESTIKCRHDDFSMRRDANTKSKTEMKREKEKKKTIAKQKWIDDSPKCHRTSAVAFGWRWKSLFRKHKLVNGNEIGNEEKSFLLFSSALKSTFWFTHTHTHTDEMEIFVFVNKEKTMRNQFANDKKEQKNANQFYEVAWENWTETIVLLFLMICYELKKNNRIFTFEIDNSLIIKFFFFWQFFFLAFFSTQKFEWVKRKFKSKKCASFICVHK